MDEDDVWDAMEDLHREGSIDRASSGGDEPAFTLTDVGNERAERLLQENDQAVLFLMRIAYMDQETVSERAEAIEALAEKLRDDVGVNAFRVMDRYPDKSVVNTGGLSVEYVEQFDP